MAKHLREAIHVACSRAERTLVAWRYAEAGGKVHMGELWLEALAGSKWLVFRDATGSAGPTGPWTVAPGEVFVLGDNRENSHDSRGWFGGKGGGLPVRFIAGSVPADGAPTLPKGAEPLAPALQGRTAAAIDTMIDRIARAPLLA